MTTMFLVMCHHGIPAERCHQCVSLDYPPVGYRFDPETCSFCWRSRELHDICEAKVPHSARHRFIPVLRPERTQ